jgi:hypothetical protein
VVLECSGVFWWVLLGSAGFRWVLVGSGVFWRLLVAFGGFWWFWWFQKRTKSFQTGPPIVSGASWFHLVGSVVVGGQELPMISAAFWCVLVGSDFFGGAQKPFQKKVSGGRWHILTFGLKRLRPSMTHFRNCLA